MLVKIFEGVRRGDGTSASRSPNTWQTSRRVVPASRVSAV